MASTPRRTAARQLSSAFPPTPTPEIVWLAIATFFLWLSPSVSAQVEIAQPESLADLLEDRSLQGDWLYQQGRFPEALELEQELLAIRQELLGPEHIETARSYFCLARLRFSMGELDSAETLLNRSLRIVQAVEGSGSANHAKVLGLLGLVYLETARFELAEDYLEKASEIRLRLFGPLAPETLESDNNLASLYQEVGNFSDAEASFRRSLEGLAALPEPPDLRLATVKNNLANLYLSTGDLLLAEKLFEESLEIRRRLVPRHPATAASLFHLALVSNELGLDDSARSYFVESLARTRSSLGNSHPQTARVLQGFGDFLCQRREFASARARLRESREIRHLLGNPNPLHEARFASILGLCRGLQGDLVEAEVQLERSFEIRRKIFGDSHGSTLANQMDLGMVQLLRGDERRAELRLRTGLDAVRQELDRLAGLQSERQQLAASAQARVFLDIWLTAAARVGTPASEQAARLLSWKGAVTTHQILGRRAPDSAAAQDLQRELAEISRDLSLLSAPGTDPPSEARQQRLRDLMDRRERLEADLMRASRTYRRLQVIPSIAEVQRALPRETALIDILVYNHFDLPHHGPIPPQGIELTPRVLGFLIRRDRPVVRIDFGKEEDLVEAIDVWRRGSYSVHSRRLIERLLARPLRRSTEGIARLLVSPDGVLGTLPWGALPGDRETFWIEEKAIAVLPIPRLLPDLLARQGSSPVDSLMIVGDLDFGPVSPGRGRVFAPLPYTGQEARAIRQVFRQRFPGRRATILAGPWATEATVRRQARDSEWLHLATHGFFDTASDPYSAARRLPRLAQSLFEIRRITELSLGTSTGIALSGANVSVPDQRDDGILTALEVAATDFGSAETVVLSACQTGLGVPLAGEGILGLQRAFQLSGLRTAVTTLWSVDDHATRLLMEEFYRNHWRQGLDKLEALRRAQLWMMSQEGASTLASRRRGVGVEEDPDPGAGRTVEVHDWAGFTLSGDWR